MRVPALISNTCKVVECMDDRETIVHSFVVKIWLEEANAQTGDLWRGHITHVPDNERHYFQTLAGLNAFIELYVTNMRASSTWGRRSWLVRLSIWLRRRKRV